MFLGIPPVGNNWFWFDEANWSESSADYKNRERYKAIDVPVIVSEG